MDYLLERHSLLLLHVLGQMAQISFHRGCDCGGWGSDTSFGKFALSWSWGTAGYGRTLGPGRTAFPLDVWVFLAAVCGAWPLGRGRVRAYGYGVGLIRPLPTISVRGFCSVPDQTRSSPNYVYISTTFGGSQLAAVQCHDRMYDRFFRTARL